MSSFGKLVAAMAVGFIGGVIGSSCEREAYKNITTEENNEKNGGMETKDNGDNEKFKKEIEALTGITNAAKNCFDVFRQGRNVKSQASPRVDDIEFSTKLSEDQLRKVLCNKNVSDAVRKVLEENGGEYRPGHSFLDKEKQETKLGTVEGIITDVKRPPTTRWPLSGDDVHRLHKLDKEVIKKHEGYTTKVTKIAPEDKPEEGQTE